MKNENIINKIKEFSKKPKQFDRECGNIWTEEHIAKEMLKAHLDPEFDGASRRALIIEKSVNFLNEKILKANSKILDLGCGPGLYAEKLCTYGHEITGIDFSENTINYAKSSAERQGLNIEYKWDDLFNLKYFEKYDAVMQIYGEINTFSDNERDRLFNIVYKALKPNGIFIFDVSTPTLRKKCGLKKNWRISEGGFWRKTPHIILEEGFQYDDDVWLDQFIIVNDEKVQVYRNWYHDYNIETIKRIIESHRFKVIGTFGGLTGEALKGGSEWIAVIAQKTI